MTPERRSAKGKAYFPLNASLAFIGDSVIELCLLSHFTEQVLRGEEEQQAAGGGEAGEAGEGQPEEGGGVEHAEARLTIKDMPLVLQQAKLLLANSFFAAVVAQRKPLTQALSRRFIDNNVLPKLHLAVHQNEFDKTVREEPWKCSNWYSASQIFYGQSTKPMADLFEALVAAVFLDLDGDLDQTWKVVRTWLEGVCGGKLPTAGSLIT